MRLLMIFILLLSFLSVTYETYALTDSQVTTRIGNVQGTVPAGTPSAPTTGMDQKGYIGEIIANIFDSGTQKIKTVFISAFQNIVGGNVNTVPRWNGQSFLAGTITDSGTGVGINTTTPGVGYVLDVNGNTNIRGDINYTGDLYKNGSLFTGGKFVDGTNVQDAVYSGVGTRNVGIGTTSPVSKFQVEGNITANDTGDSNFVQLWADNAIIAGRNGSLDRLRFAFADGLNAQSFSEKMSILDTGEVGIGTVTPTERLEVAGSLSSRNTTPGFIMKNTTTGAIGLISGNSGSGSLGIFADMNNAVAGSKISMFIDDTSTPKMTILDTGNVGVGTTTPIQRLDVNGKIRMQSQTVSADSIDTVATKGYVDTKSTLSCRTVTSTGVAPNYQATASCNSNEFLLNGGGSCQASPLGVLHYSSPVGDSWVADCWRNDNAGENIATAVATCCLK